MARKQFKDLDLKNAFLFAAALQDEETCQLILEMILGKEVPRPKVHVEQSLLLSSDFRSIRLDVYAKDEMEVTYDLEMENWDKKELPKRSRFHQAEMDMISLKPGERFTELKPSYVIFICTQDPFHLGFYRYTFEQHCKEGNFPLGDEAYRIFLNTKGTNDGEVPKLLVHFLHYIENSSDSYTRTVSDQKIDKLHAKICELKRSREWEAHYMTLQEYLEHLGKELAEEMAEELAEEKAEKLAEEKAKELAEEKARELAEKLAEEKARELAEKLAEEKARELAEKLAEEKARELAEKLAEEKARELAEKLAEEKARELAEKLAEEKARELAEKLAEEMVEKIRRESY